MDFKNVKLFGMMQQRMAYLSERQAHISGNIANINTPGYVPKDLKKVNFQELAEKSASSNDLHLTNPKHMTIGGNSGQRFAVESQKNNFETTIVGNEVNMDEQLMKMANTSADYQATVSTYKKMMQIMLSATGRGGQ